jgi:hypothetical protein
VIKDPKYVIRADPEAFWTNFMADHAAERNRRKKLLPKHAKKNIFFRRAYQLTASKPFNTTFILITILNTVTLASYHKMLSTESQK